MKDFMAIGLGILLVCIIGFTSYQIETWRRKIQYAPQIEQMESSRVELRRIADSLEVLASNSIKIIDRQSKGTPVVQLPDMQGHIGTIQVVPEISSITLYDERK